MMSLINMESTSKKSKASMRNDARDRLSELPDEILVHILSFLPILDAVRTVLIRRFGNLWTLVSSLHFKDYEFFKAENWPGIRIDYDEHIPRFTSFVRNVLMLHKGIPVDKFLLRFLDVDVCDDDCESFITDIKLWIRFAIGREVKELEVQFEIDDFDLFLPRCVFTSQFLVKLKFDRCEIEGLSRVQMGSLRKLSLTFVKVSNEMFKKVIFGCPSLQELVLRYAYGLNELQFTAPNIEKLDLKSRYLSVLDCPNLKILNIHLNCSTVSCLQIDNISSVREVHIGYVPRFEKIVNQICKAEVVKISDGAFLQSFFKELHVPQTRWKCLHIVLYEDQFIGICRVLRSLPHLEELIVSSWRKDKTHDHHMLSEELSSPCVIPQLKTVTVHCCAVPCQSLLLLAKFSLKSCVNLEKMIFTSTRLTAAPLLLSLVRLKYQRWWIFYSTADEMA
uniref:F-box domain-containing protein n=1 Tax=Chenopodium quinoa TaxID=63459 RepID=A0A803ME70_CHEQI